MSNTDSKDYKRLYDKYKSKYKSLSNKMSGGAFSSYETACDEMIREENNFFELFDIDSEYVDKLMSAKNECSTETEIYKDYMFINKPKPFDTKAQELEYHMYKTENTVILLDFQLQFARINSTIRKAKIKVYNTKKKVANATKTVDDAKKKVTNITKELHGLNSITPNMNAPSMTGIVPETRTTDLSYINKKLEEQTAKLTDGEKELKEQTANLNADKNDLTKCENELKATIKSAKDKMDAKLGIATVDNNYEKYKTMFYTSRESFNNVATNARRSIFSLGTRYDNASNTESLLPSQQNAASNNIQIQRHLAVLAKDNYESIKKNLKIISDMAKNVPYNVDNKLYCIKYTNENTHTSKDNKLKTLQFFSFEPCETTSTSTIDFILQYMKPNIENNNIFKKYSTFNNYVPIIETFSKKKICFLTPTQVIAKFGTIGSMEIYGSIIPSLATNKQTPKKINLHESYMQLLVPMSQNIEDHVVPHREDPHVSDYVEKHMVYNNIIGDPHSVQFKIYNNNIDYKNINKTDVVKYIDTILSYPLETIHGNKGDDYELSLNHHFYIYGIFLLYCCPYYDMMFKNKDTFLEKYI